MGRLAKKKLPFAKSHVNRLIKTYSPEKEVSRTAREKLNILLGQIAKDIIADFNKSEYRRIDAEYFITASKEYRSIRNLHLVKNNIKYHLDELQKKIQDIDQLLVNMGSLEV